MTIIDLFSKRMRRSRGEIPDVYTYEDLPTPLRVQIVQIIRDAIGRDERNNDASQVYQLVHDTLCREYGQFKLVKYSASHETDVFEFFLECKDVEKCLDVVEFFFKVIDKVVRSDSYQWNTSGRKTDPDEAIEELNTRFKEHGIGYEFTSGEIIRVDSALIHAEAVKPALALLREIRFAGANEEFLSAHEHYRHGRYKESLVDSLKAFESVLKVICGTHKWPIRSQDTAKTLIDTAIKNGLIPSYLQSQFGALRSLLESGVPTVRNKLGGHGQGSQATKIPEHVARYALNLCATNILFLVDSEKKMK